MDNSNATDCSNETNEMNETNETIQMLANLKLIDVKFQRSLIIARNCRSLTAKVRFRS